MKLAEIIATIVKVVDRVNRVVNQIDESMPHGVVIHGFTEAERELLICQALTYAGHDSKHLKTAALKVIEERRTSMDLVDESANTNE